MHVLFLRRVMSASFLDAVVLLPQFFCQITGMLTIVTEADAVARPCDPSVNASASVRGSVAVLDRSVSPLRRIEDLPPQSVHLLLLSAQCFLPKPYGSVSLRSRFVEALPPDGKISPLISTPRSCTFLPSLVFSVK